MNILGEFNMTLSEVLKQRHALQSAGTIEANFLSAYVHNSRDASHKEVAKGFRACNRVKLMEVAGDKIDHFPWPLAVFRGVSGCRRHRLESGYSWTTNLPAACWFATREKRRYPAIMVASVGIPDVFAIIGRVAECEVVVIPKKSYQLKISDSEMKRLSRQYVRYNNQESI